jgi:nucleoside diphosphate kinase
MNTERYFLNRADEIEQSEYSKLFESLDKYFPLGWDNNIENFSFVMLKPNAYLSNSIPEIFSEFKKNDIDIMEYKLIYLTEEHLDNLYCFIKNKYASSWWVMQKVYSLAPCLVAIVQGEKFGFDHLSSRIRSLVGSTTPIISRRDSIRYSPYSMTRIFNTIHATDDPASAIREALVFFSKETILNILQNHGKERTNEIIENPKSFLGKRNDVISFSGIKHQLKSGIVDKAFNIIPNSERKEYLPIVDSLIQLKSLLLKENSIIEQILPLRDEFIRISPILNIEKLCLSFIERSAERSIRDYLRNPNPISDSFYIDTLANIKKLIQLIYPLTDDALFFSINNFEVYLAEINFLAFRLTPYQQTVMLGCWAGAFEELRDISTKWPIEEM